MIPSFENANEYAEYLRKNGLDAHADTFGQPPRVGVWVNRVFYGFGELNKPTNAEARDGRDFEAILANRGK